MSSRPAVWLALVLALSAIACGRKEAPKPPPSKIPAPIANLAVQQRGMEYHFRMSYPQSTIGGLPIETLEAVEIWEMTRIIPSFLGTPVLDEQVDASGEQVEGVELGMGDQAVAEEQPEEGVAEEADAEPGESAEEEAGLFRLPPAVTEAGAAPTRKEDQIMVDPREFGQLAELRLVLPRAELEAAVIGDQLLARIPIESLPEEEEVHIFAARVVAGRRLISAYSNLVKLLPRRPPEPPGSLMVTPQPNGVEITWTATDEELGHRVYRRLATVRDYSTPLFAAPAGLGSYLDISAQFEQRYIYTVTAVGLADPLVESGIAAEHEINYQDRFPPDPPMNIVALAEEGRVRLLWERSTSKDVTGYRIYRQQGGGEFLLVNLEAVVGSEYLDRNLAGGQLYRYFIVAVDGAGNPSIASEEVEARVP